MLDSFALPCKKLYWAPYRKHNLISLVYRRTKCVVLRGEEAHFKEFSAPKYAAPRPKSTCTRALGEKVG